MGILSFTYNAAKKALRGKNVTPGQAIKKTQVGTKLAFKRGEQDKFVKFRDTLHKSAGFDTATKNKLKSKQPLTKINKGKSDIFTPKEPKLATGGRVGEKGAELFIPATSGKIIPNHQLSGGGGIVINQSVNFATGVQDTVKNEVLQLLPDIAETSKAAVVEAMNRGGNFRRGMR